MRNAMQEGKRKKREIRFRVFRVTLATGGIGGVRVEVQRMGGRVHVSAAGVLLHTLSLAQLAERLTEPPSVYGVLHEREGVVYGNYATRAEAADRAADAEGNGVSARVVAMQA